MEKEWSSTVSVAVLPMCYKLSRSQCLQEKPGKVGESDE